MGSVPPCISMFWGTIFAGRVPAHSELCIYFWKGRRQCFAHLYFKHEHSGSSPHMRNNNSLKHGLPQPASQRTYVLPPSFGCMFCNKTISSLITLANKSSEPGQTIMSGPSRAELGRAEPSWAEPFRAEPGRAEPGRAGPQTPTSDLVYMFKANFSPHGLVKYKSRAINRTASYIYIYIYIYIHRERLQSY